MADKREKRTVMGRPPADIDPDKLKALCRLKPTLDDCAAFFDVHPDTITKYVRKHFNCTFSEFRDKYVVETRYMLIRKAIDMARNGNTAMMIFCLKNLCKWADRVEHTDAPAQTLKLAYNIDDVPNKQLKAAAEVIDAEEADE